MMREKLQLLFFFNYFLSHRSTCGYLVAILKLLEPKALLKGALIGVWRENLRFSPAGLVTYTATLQANALSHHGSNMYIDV